MGQHGCQMNVDQNLGYQNMWQCLGTLLVYLNGENDALKPRDAGCLGA